MRQQGRSAAFIHHAAKSASAILVTNGCRKRASSGQSPYTVLNCAHRFWKLIDELTGGTSLVGNRRLSWFAESQPLSIAGHFPLRRGVFFVKAVAVQTSDYMFRKGLNAC